MRLSQKGAVDALVVFAVISVMVMGVFVLLLVGGSEDSTDGQTSQSQEADESANREEQSTDEQTPGTQQGDLSRQDYSDLLDNILIDLNEVTAFEFTRSGVVRAYFYGPNKAQLSLGSLGTTTYFDGEFWVHVHTGGDDPFCTFVSSLPDEFIPTCIGSEGQLVKSDSYSEDNLTYTLDP